MVNRPRSRTKKKACGADPILARVWAFVLPRGWGKHNFSQVANRLDAQFTVNVPSLPVPPIVVTAIGPVMAPVGTLAVIFVAEFTVNVVALTPPNVTFDAPVKPVPTIVTGVPTEPDVGLKEVTAGRTLKLVCVLSLPLGVVTVTKPVSEAGETTAVMKLALTTLKLVAAMPSKSTAVAPVNPVPRMSTVWPDLAE